MAKRVRSVFLLLVFCLTVAFGCRQASDPAATRSNQHLTVTETLGNPSTDGFARAMEPREFVFPRDHGPHPEFKTEWWYYTGNLATRQGRRFGYQLTFFRIGLHPEPVERPSAWAANQIYMAHFAVTDPQESRFRYDERFSRAAQGLAGAQAAPFRVWLDHWLAEGAGETALPMHLYATGGGVGIDLLLDSAKRPVLQGDGGLSQKSAEPGNASYYYSLTRMPTRGIIHIDEERYEVVGHSWLDREWSTSALGENQVGWDWFSLQLDDGRELMYYQLRRTDGRADPLSSGVLVAPDGAVRRLLPRDLEIEVLGNWVSPHSGARYPVRWRLRLPHQGLNLTIAPLMVDQELQTTVRYWEGAVAVQGTDQNGSVGGLGYVELTGYAK